MNLLYEAHRDRYEEGVSVERMVEANGVELCTERSATRRLRLFCLIMGRGASMRWWEEGFCGMLAERGRFVIRYDHRDTGRSVTSYPRAVPGTRGWTWLPTPPACHVYGISAAHMVGVSSGRRDRSAARARLPRARPLARPGQHLARDPPARAPLGDRGVQACS